MSDIKDEIDSSYTVVESNEISKLFNLKSVDIERYENLPEKIVPSLPKFTEGKIQASELCKLFGALLPSSLTLDKHGYSMKTTQKSLEAGSSPPVKQLLDEPETVTTIETGYRYLIGVACLSDEEIWTSGDKNRTMKLYSINQGSLLKSIRTKTGNTPTDIAVAKSGDLLYTNNKDRTVNIVKSEKIEVIRLQNWRPKGVCSSFSGDLLVTMISDDYKQTKVVCYSDSTEKQTVQFDDKDKPLYSSSSDYITENKNLDICVSDTGANALVVVNQAGKLRFRYTGHTSSPQNKPFRPQGITTDSQSHILTADNYNECIHIIDQDGQFLRYIECGLNNPIGLCTDTYDNLFVAEYNKGQVKKLKFLK
ncbi:uncharacterized protein LOC134274582 [Saccostrea cucullata]|uniref:uncharacterized protein LOC134274582 n=1 Tax=Saccostrea cuccullata TaxID=36930 RepID=UPI002ECFBB5A